MAIDSNFLTGAILDEKNLLNYMRDFGQKWSKLHAILAKNRPKTTKLHEILRK